MAARPGRDKGAVRLALPLIRLADLALPPRCPGCGRVTEADHRFCAACWSSLRFITPPWCPGCCLPFEVDRGAALCGECLASPPRHAGVRAAVGYGEVARTVALKLKYGGRTAYAETMARAMARLMPHDAELLVPVPLHRWRLWGRGFNQSALIADALMRHTGVPVAPRALVRKRATPVLRGLGAKARARTVSGVFAIPMEGRAELRGKALVLIDDVYTSGATAGACVRLLLRAGAPKVTILCWTRVLRGDGD